MDFVNLSNKLVSLKNLKTSEPFNGAYTGPSLKLQYSDQKTPLYISFKSMEEAEEGNKKLMEELKKEGLIS